MTGITVDAHGAVPVPAGGDAGAPRRDPDVELVWRQVGGRRVAVAVDRRRGRYRRLGEARALIWTLCDGRRTVAQIAAEIRARGGALDEGVIADVIATLRRSGLVGDDARAAHEVGPGTARRRVASACRQVLTARTERRDVDPAARWLYAAIARPLFAPLARVAIAIVQVLGLVLFAIQAGEHARLVPAAGWWALLVPVLLVCTLLHEAAHAMAVKHFGRRVIGAGIGWFWVGPYAYVNTSDMWLEGKRRRVLVSLAGPLSDALAAGLLAIVAVLSRGWLSDVALAASALLYAGIVANLSPFLEYDGYYALADLLDRPNLRRQSLRWLLTEFRPAPGAWRAIASHRVEFSYCAGSLLYLVVLVIAAAHAAIAGLTTLLADTAPRLAAPLAWSVALLASLALVAGLLGDLASQAEPWTGDST